MATSNRTIIMFIISSMADALAGTERNLDTIISQLDKEEFETHLITLQDCPYIRSSQNRCNTASLNVYRMFTPQMLRGHCRLTAMMRTLGVDIVQTFSTDAHLVGGRAARAAGVKAIISSRRDLGFSYTLKEKVYLKIANRYPHRFLANSNAVANAISKIERIDRNRIDVIYNGVELADRSPMVRPNEQSVLLVANLRPVKLVSTLILAAALVTQVVPDVRFTIIGDGPERPMLEGMTRDLGLQARFDFLGKQRNITPFLHSSAVGVLTSKSEGFSNAILEYMAAGLPVIATAVGGNREMVADGETGFLVPVSNERTLADRLVYLLQNEEIAAQMGQRGRELVQNKFSIDIMMREYRKYYHELAKPRFQIPAQTYGTRSAKRPLSG